VEQNFSWVKSLLNYVKNEGIFMDKLRIIYTTHQKTKQNELIRSIRTKLLMFQKSGLETHLDSAVHDFNNLKTIQVDHEIENKLEATKTYNNQFWKQKKVA
jgi:hypothetical protein